MFMNSLFSIFPLVAIALVTILPTMPLRSQDATPADLPMGSDVLKERIGPTAAWQIAYRPLRSGGNLPESAVEGAGTAGGSTDSDATKLLEIERAGNVNYVRLTHENGEVDEFWTVEDRKIADVAAFGGLIYVSPNYVPTQNFQETDFPELGWVRTTRASSLTDYQGTACYIFEADAKTVEGYLQQIAAADGDPEGADNVGPAEASRAFINAETGLPVAAVTGQRAGFYTYNAAPDKLAIPGDFRQGFNDWTKLIESKMPARSEP